MGLTRSVVRILAYYDYLDSSKGSVRPCIYVSGCGKYVQGPAQNSSKGQTYEMGTLSTVLGCHLDLLRPVPTRSLSEIESTVSLSRLRVILTFTNVRNYFMH
jgi:hypothetical protein